MADIVLITGASSGIGAASARLLVDAGYTVYATGRDVQKLEPLAALGCRILPLDVTDEASMQAAVDSILAAEGRIDILINNAGYGQYGALEVLPLDLMRQQFETNVFGLMRLTQIVLPSMRRQRRGRIINISSMAAYFTFPGGGIYHASKHAVNALSDALRFEVEGFGIDVVTIEPGMIRSGFSGTVVGSIAGGERNDAYAEFDRRLAITMRKSYEAGATAKFTGTPEDVATVVLKAVTAKRPRTRYRITFAARFLIALHALLPDRLWDRLLATRFYRPRS